MIDFHNHVLNLEWFTPTFWKFVLMSSVKLGVIKPLFSNSDELSIIPFENEEEAIAITNGLTRYIPMLIALSANSPYFMGEDTGLASSRTKIFEGLPTAGRTPV